MLTRLLNISPNVCLTKKTVLEAMEEAATTTIVAIAFHFANNVNFTGELPADTNGRKTDQQVAANMKIMREHFGEVWESIAELQTSVLALQQTEPVVVTDQGEKYLNKSKGGENTVVGAAHAALAVINAANGEVEQDGDVTLHPIPVKIPNHEAYTVRLTMNDLDAIHVALGSMDMDNVASYVTEEKFGREIWEANVRLYKSLIHSDHVKS